VRRHDLLDALAERIVACAAAHPLRVAVDGSDAAGKTTLADELAAPLRARGRPVIRASVDVFHRPRAERYRRGAASPEGYYLDAFDTAALRDALLLPLGPGGSRWYRCASFDFRTDRAVHAPLEEAAADAVLVVDGVFLLRPELVAHWDYRIFVEVPLRRRAGAGAAPRPGALRLGGGGARALPAALHPRPADVLRRRTATAARRRHREQRGPGQPGIAPA
jgi:uridine kinase